MGKLAAGRGPGPEDWEAVRAAGKWQIAWHEKNGTPIFIDGGSPILSVVIGDETTTMEFNKLLFEHGVFVNPVLPPAAPPGMSLLRTSYMATHTDEDLDLILEAFRPVSAKLRIPG